MRILILSRSRNLHSTRRLLIEATRQRVECLVVNPLRCQLTIGPEGPEIYLFGKKLEGVDVVVPRIGTSITEYGLLVVRHFECMGVPIVNSSDSILNSRNKFRALQVCSSKGVPAPLSVMSRALTDIHLAYRRIGKFPMVMKLLQGAQGIGVMLGHDRSSVESVMATLLEFDKDLILQEFVKEASGSDVRILVVGGKAVAAMRRTARKGEFRANVHRGGLGEKIMRLPKSYERLALLAAKSVGLDIAGVDLLETNNGPVLLEVNSSPGFQELEKATKVNVAEKMIRMAIRKGRSRRRKRK
ncbi:MAG TPA: RimK family alpha-L-glutamate ligase [Bdellovibrionota bacterium]|jgi:ribosomal protein S6--L-glutamate ligase